MHSLRTTVLLLGALVLVPATAYVAYEVTTLSANEQMIAEIYDQQLETILYSVNQYAWDVAQGQADKLCRQLGDGPPQQAAQRFLSDHPEVAQILTADGDLTDVRAFSREGTTPPPPLRLTPADARRLITYQAAGYRKFHAVALHEADSLARMALVFACEVPEGEPEGERASVAGFVLDARAYIDDLLAPKLLETSRGQFVIGLFESGQEVPRYATGTLARREARQERAVWLFPEFFQLGIGLAGTSVEAALRTRYKRNLALVAVLALVLLGAAWVVYRNVRRTVELANMKADFVSNVSHELRTPLSLIRMFAETLELDRVRSEAQRQSYYRIISQETDRLSRLVGSILSFSKMEAGQKQYRFGEVDLNEVARESLARYAYHLEQNGFEVTTHLHTNVPPVLGDEEAVAEVLLNLIDNAVKYSRDMKRIDVSTSLEDGFACLSVRDSGIGISESEQRRIFDKFYRVSTGLVHDVKGTGLGLALVQHIMEAHGGAVAVESEPGAGSAFRLRFPVVVRPEAPHPAPTP